MKQGTHKITIYCNKTCCGHLLEILDFFKQLANSGCTRDFIIDGHKFTFDGDGPDRITGLTWEQLKRSKMPANISKHKALFDSETLYAVSEAEASHYVDYRKYENDGERHDNFKAFDAGYRKGFRAAQYMLKDRIRYAVFNESNEN